MSRGSSILIGLAIGAAAAAVYRRRELAQLLGSPRLVAALPPAGSSPALSMSMSKGSPMQNVSIRALDTIRDISTTLQQEGPRGLVEQGRRYFESARKQLDVAIAEGQVAAAQTRQELEARFAAAKADPQSARSAFR